MNLFKGLDSEKTKQAAKNTLEAYRFLKRVSGEKFSSKVTAVYSFEPRSYTGTVSNPIESHMVRQVAAQQRVDEIEQAINMMTEAFHKQLLYEKYCVMKERKDIEIYMMLEYSETEFYRMLDEALFNFAEVYRYGELLVFKDGQSFEDFLGVN